MFGIKPRIYVMPVGSTASSDVLSDYEGMLNSLRKLNADLVIGSPLNDEVSILQRVEEVRRSDFDA
ncbi:MAG: hypothetical protein QXW61_06770, partial [Sulfolobales archaeon]